MIVVISYQLIGDSNCTLICKGRGIGQHGQQRQWPFPMLLPLTAREELLYLYNQLIILIILLILL
jgi:hypothetical protein